MSQFKREFDFQKRKLKKRWDQSSGSVLWFAGLTVIFGLVIVFAQPTRQKQKVVEKISLSSESQSSAQDLANTFDPQFKKWAQGAQSMIRFEKNKRYYLNLDSNSSALSLKQEQSPLAQEEKSVLAPRHLPENSVLYSLQNKQQKRDPDFIERFKQNAEQAGYAVEIDPVSLDILEVRDLQTGEILPADQVDF